MSRAVGSDYVRCFQVTEKNRVWNETWNQDCMAILKRCYTGHQQEAGEDDKA